MKAVRNISDEPIDVRDKTQPGHDEPPEPVTVKPGKSLEISDDKATELLRDYPEHFEAD